MLRLPLREALKHLLHVADPGERHHLRTADFVGCRNGRNDAAFNRIEGAFPRLFGSENIVVGGTDGFELDVLFFEPAVEILKRQRKIEKLGMLFRFLLFRDARPDGRSISSRARSARPPLARA